MGPYQEEIYNYFEEIEEKREKLARMKRNGSNKKDQESTYNAYTRQACNFVFPTINNKITGEKRPRPGQFKIKDYEANKIDEGKKVITKISLELEAYIKVTKDYINTTINFFKDLYRKDKEDNYTILDDLKTYKNIYNSSFSNFLEKEKKKSLLFNQLYECSPKMVTIIFNIFKSKGPILIYSNYVNMEGLQILKIYLHFFGFFDLDNDDKFDHTNLEKTCSNDFFRYVEYHGAIKKENREINKSLFNNKINKYGKIAKIMMISPAGAEGINLYNVRQVHILEPYWNEVRIEQVIGRAIRQCQHKDLPMEERRVDVFRYKMVRKNNKETSDEKMENISRRKNNLLISFIEAIKEVAIDCELFKAHNMMGTKYSCFQFNENTLFEPQVGPAYLNDIEMDKKMNNGSNSKDSIKLKIKVRKIFAVTKLTENTYSEAKPYWYYDKTHVVYDNDLNFPVGKIELDEFNNEKKLNNNILIIDKLINIPTFKIY